MEREGGGTEGEGEREEEPEREGGALHGVQSHKSTHVQVTA